MITKEIFVNFITRYKQISNRVDELDNILGSNLWDTNMYNDIGMMFDLFVESHFTEDKQDIISWWMFNDGPHIIDDVNLDTAEDLYDYITHE